MAGILVRATIHLPGVPVGTLVTVDPDSEYIENCLKRKFLVPVEDPPADPGGKTTE